MIKNKHKWYVHGNGVYNLDQLLCVTLEKYNNDTCKDWYIQFTYSPDFQTVIDTYKSSKEAHDVWQNILKILSV